MLPSDKPEGKNHFCSFYLKILRVQTGSWKTSVCVRVMRIYACIRDLSFSGSVILHPAVRLSIFFCSLSIISSDSDTGIPFGWQSWIFFLPVSHKRLADGILWEMKEIRWQPVPCVLEGESTE